MDGLSDDVCRTEVVSARRMVPLIEVSASTVVHCEVPVVCTLVVPLMPAPVHTSLFSSATEDVTVVPVLSTCKMLSPAPSPVQPSR